MTNASPRAAAAEEEPVWLFGRAAARARAGHVSVRVSLPDAAS
jgi:hypothetical protein